MFFYDGLVEKNVLVMPVLDQVRDDVSGIPNMLALLDSGFRRNDKLRANSTFYEIIFYKPQNDQRSNRPS